MNIKTKLITISSALAIIPVIASVLILESLSTQTANEAMENAARNQLVSIRDTKKYQIEDYFDTIRNQALTLSNDRMIIDAMRQFKASFRKVTTDSVTEKSIDEMRTAVASYYRKDFGGEYKRLNAGKSIDTKRIIKQLDDESIVLQYHYIKANPNPLGNKHKLDGAEDGSEYSWIHKRFHPHIRDFLEKFEYYDIFLVDPDSGDIVYSVFKELDYTTSMIDGPYANTGIGKAFRAANSLNNADGVALVDFKPYAPSYEAAASFIASPIYDGNEKVGILIFQMPIGKINTIMTSHEKWKDIGLGDSGETYLVGPDTKARSMSRFLIEDQDNYMKLMQEVGMPQNVISEMKAKETNIGLQTIDTLGTRAALAGNSGFDIFPDYRNVKVLSAYTPLNIPGLKWALMSEIDEDEAFAPIKALDRKIITASIIMFLIIATIAVSIGLFFALSITKPIIRLSETMEQVQADNDLTLRSDVHSKDEIGIMAQAFNTMLEKFEALIQQVISSSTQLATASEEVSSVAGESATNVERQRNETDQVATAINEMTATVQEVANNASSAAGAAANADNEAMGGKSVVENASQVIAQLAGEIEKASSVITEVEQDSENIGGVLDVIKGIAEQTNLLALNAAIEAARAGEQGRGFAVVADEVRTLASRTQESASEIESMIEKLQSGAQNAVAVMENSREQAQAGVEQANQAGEALAAITRAVATITEMNIQIASAAEEQSAVSEEINRNVTCISQISEQTASGAEQTTCAATELAQLASELQNLVRQFKINT